MRGCPTPHETHKGSRYMTPFPASPHRLRGGSHRSRQLVEEEGWGTPTCSGTHVLDKSALYRVPWGLGRSARYAISKNGSGREQVDGSLVLYVVSQT